MKKLSKRKIVMNEMDYIKKEASFSLPFKINWLDLIGSSLLLLSLWLIPTNNNWWLLYAFACFIWIRITFSNKLYFGMIMNTIATIIGLTNFFRGL